MGGCRSRRVDGRGCFVYFLFKILYLILNYLFPTSAYTSSDVPCRMCGELYDTLKAGGGGAASYSDCDCHTV